VRQLYGSLGIAHTDDAGRLSQYKRNFEFFNAPVALFITIHRGLGPGQWADLGGYIHALAYLARGYGLDTCRQEAWARLDDTVGEYLKLPPEQMLFCAVAIGYGPKAQGQRLPVAPCRRFRVLQILWLRLAGSAVEKADN
jgi:nitroreductase